jgi:hypothetical protein
VPSADIGLTGARRWLSGHIVPSDRYNLERYALIMAHGDATMIMNGGNSCFIDQPSTLEFLKEYKQLPTAPFNLAPGSLTTQNTVVRQLTAAGNASMFYAVNRTNLPRVATITFGSDTTVTRPSNGASQATTNKVLSLSLQPFEMIVYAVTGANATILNVTSN